MYPISRSNGIMGLSIGLVGFVLILIAKFQFFDQQYAGAGPTMDHRPTHSPPQTSGPMRLTRPSSKDATHPSEEWHQIEKQVVMQGGSGIPKILHYVFKNELAFEAYKPLIRSCLDQNPDWQVFLWRDSDSEKLIQRDYGHFIDKYRSYGNRLEKSDSIRYMIMHKFGGIYLDMDIQCLKPFDQLLQQLNAESHASPDEFTAFLGEERREQTRILYRCSFYTMNSLMGSRPGHQFFKYMVDRMKSVKNSNDARVSTGPELLTNVYHSWVKCPACWASDPVHVFPARLVSPLMDTSMVQWDKRCEHLFNAKPGATHGDVWIKLGCAELVAKGWRFDETDSATVAVHRFLHLGYGNRNGLKTFNLLNEFPRIKLPVIGKNATGGLF